MSLLTTFLSWSQSSDFQTNHSVYTLVDRWHTRSGQQFFSSVKPYSRHSTTDLVVSPLENVSKSDVFNRDYVLKESWEAGYDSLARMSKPLWKKLYVYEPDFFAYKGKDVDFHLNPIWNLSFGKDSNLDKVLFVNSRGLEFRGTIDRRISFYSGFTENQAQYPTYIKNVADTVGVLPYEGFWKEYNETTTDFFRVIGHINVDFTRHIGMQLGYGRHFIGNGQRSLFLSDFGNSYPYLRSTMQVWKIKYTNLFAKLTADVGIYNGGTLGASDYPNKYMNSHYFDISVLPNLNIGIFESVIYGKPDSLGGSSPKMEYFVPFVFLRGVEQQDGSGDNSVLGLEVKWSVWKHLQIYGQFMLDDFSVNEARSGDMWWGNKYGTQIGAKYFDFFIPNLDMQVEYNTARPFMYAHQDLYTAYTQYRQPLAHPLGANFKEFLAELNYQPIPRLTSEVTFLVAKYGNDVGDGYSYGRDPLLSYNLRNGEYGHTIGQGDPVTLLMTHINMSYQVMHNLFVDLNFTIRSEQIESKVESANSTIFNAGFRWNSSRRSYIF